MQVPLEISYHNTDRSAWIDDYIRERADHLERVTGGIISCRVVVERTQAQHINGNPFRVRVEVTLPPRKELVGDKEEIVQDMEMQFRPIIRHAFDAVEKQARKLRDQQQGNSKQHNNPQTLSEPRPLASPTGFVVRLFPDDGYGFLKIDSDNEEYYFHRNAVLHNDFDRIEIGTQVRFEPSEGKEGPQASTVQIIDKPGKRAGKGNTEAARPPAGW